MMEPRIESLDLKLIGVGAVFSNIEDVDFAPVIGNLFSRVERRLDEIPYLLEPTNSVGYWHTVDGPAKLYFAGVPVRRITCAIPEGLYAWDFGDMTFACFLEKNGEEGTIVHGGAARHWLEGSDYTYHYRLIGDMEVGLLASYRQAKEAPSVGVHEVWIPVKPRV